MDLKELDNLISKVPLDDNLNKKLKEFTVSAKICKIAFIVSLIALAILLTIFFIVARKDLTGVAFNPFRVVMCANFVVAVSLISLNYFFNFEKLRLLNKVYKDNQHTINSDNTQNKEN